MRRWSFVLLLGLCVGSLLAAEKTVKSPSKALNDLFAEAWNLQMQEHPEEASVLGDRRFNDRWTDNSPEGFARRNAQNQEVLKKLLQIDRKALSAKDQLNYDLFKQQYEDRLEEYKFHWFLMDFNQRDGPQTSDDLANSLRFETAKDYEDWLSRLHRFPALLDQDTAFMRQGIREHMVHPKVIMERITGQLDRQIVSDATQSAFYKPFLQLPKNISQADQERLQQEGRKAVEQDVVPAFKKFKEFFVGEYLPACYDQVGAWQLPNAAELYAFMIRHHTTTNMTADQVHETGLREVARIGAAMDKIMEQTRFKGTRAEFFNFLRTDPQFFYKTPEELLVAYKALVKGVDPKLVKMFHVIPREPYGVEPIPANVAPDTTTAYYSPGAADGSRAGTYYVNLYKPETRPKWEMMALSLHESVPGHHFQFARSAELGELPMFRRFGGYTAFVEGWGLYSESLGDDMGLYSDPYSKFGQLAYEMWRAVRLVIDTGIHSKHWTREQAIQYFMENCPKHELDITNEVDRYIAWPGQALAYKIGELKIKELRARATQRLGNKFDLKAFNDVVLGSGAVPLEVLERVVDDWVASQSGEYKQAPKAQAASAAKSGR